MLKRTTVPADSAPSRDRDSSEPGAEPKPATLPQVFGAVFWSFFGVRRGKQMQRDAVTVKPLQVVVGGVLLAAVLVFALLALVNVILRTAA